MSAFNDITFDATLNAPLYQQLYSHLRNSILGGQLKNGTKLPSTRGLATELNVSRNTVLYAYQQLLAEGYLEGVEGSGTFVARLLPELLMEPPRPEVRADALPAETSRPQFSAQATVQLAAAHNADALPEPHRKAARPFRPEMPALDAFPYTLWSRLLVRRARRQPPEDFIYHDSAGYLPLREAIAAHVTVSRQVRCTPDQVMIVAGSQGGLDLVARMLLSPGDPVWMEDPGYPGARGSFLGMNAEVVPVPVDDEGLVKEAGVERAPRPRLVYLTPSHQFPTGATMSLQRRLDLLKWARRTGAYILEDDYDSEYRFVGRPLASLQGLDEGERVIYLGTFSKVLFPALRLGYLILPQALMEPFLMVRRLVDIHPPILEQAVVADFINEGHFSRHLRRMRALYAERRLALLDAIERQALDLEMSSPQAGFHCVGWLPEGADDGPLASAAGKYDLELTPISKFCIEPARRHGLLLGYGGYSVRELRAGVRRLAVALSAV